MKHSVPLSLSRANNRELHAVRPLELLRSYTRHAEGSVLVAYGDTRVLCTASVEERVPPHRKAARLGWVTAEYGMLPRATHTRGDREAARGKQSGRTQEIQRLIGRSLRAVIDMQALGERTLVLDCDVLQADGGTRCASVTGACVAAHDALSQLLGRGLIGRHPMTHLVAGVSVGLHAGQMLVDLDYAEDSSCDTDLNVIMTEAGGLVEVQGTAEGVPFSSTQLNDMVAAAQTALHQICAQQRAALAL